MTWHVGFRARTQRLHSHKLPNSTFQVRTGGALRMTSAFKCPIQIVFLFFLKHQAIEVSASLAQQRSWVWLACFGNILLSQVQTFRDKVINSVANIQLITYKALFLHQCRQLSKLWMHSFTAFDNWCLSVSIIRWLIKEYFFLTNKWWIHIKEGTTRSSMQNTGLQLK